MLLLRTPTGANIRLLIVCALGLSVSAEAVQSGKISHREAEKRARELVGRMTLDEKIAQVHGVHDHDHYRMVPGNARLGIPELRVTNGPAGVGPGGAGSQKPATALPAPIALAATWDLGLAELYGRVAGEEARALGSNLLEAPDINIARAPQGGRVFESYGEDPFLVSRFAVANIQGIQSTGVMANVKHFLANNQETNRDSINEIIDERAIREIYLPGFQAAVKEAHVASLMCAYPRVNGAYNCENQPLLGGVLKKEWGFDGFVTSDFGAVHSTAPSALAGLDLELPTGIYFGEKLKNAIQNGTVPESRLDDMIVRRLAKMIEFGWFGPKTPEKSIPAFTDGAISRRIADESMVLLKNEHGILPLDRERLKTVALIGPYAIRPVTGGGGSSHVIPRYSITPVDGLDAALLSQTKILLLDGSDIPAAVLAASKADVAIVMVGDDEGEDHDHNIELAPNQNSMIEAVAGATPNTVVVIKTGSAILMPWLDKVSAVLEAWYPGEEDGNAVADVLMGKVNPSAKLPLTFPRDVGQTVARNRDQYPGDGVTVHYSEGLEIGYRSPAGRGGAPLFPFGFGLSYTTFAFADLHIMAVPREKHRVVVQFRVTNTGSRAGADVAQVYVTYPHIPEGDEPPRQLRGFSKVFLQRGESRQIEIELIDSAFSFWSEQGRCWQIAAGQFEIAVGDSSTNTPLQGAMAIAEH